MADTELVCNYKKCRKHITSHAWVTSCSHVFCEEDGEREFTRQSSIKCPACNANLPRPIDVIKVDLNPTEQFKSMVLAGLRPDTIMDVAARAIAFWSYQVHLERVFQESSVMTYRERLSQLEISYEALVANIKSEMMGLARQIEASKKDLAAQMKRAEDLTEKLMEKTRQCQKLQVMYESMRRNSIVPSMVDQDTVRHSPRLVPPRGGFTLGPRTLADIQGSMPPSCQRSIPQRGTPHQQQFPPSPAMIQNSASEDFLFRPVTPNSDRRMNQECQSPFRSITRQGRNN